MSQKPENSASEYAATVVTDFNASQFASFARNQLDPEQRLVLDLVFAAKSDRPQLAALLQAASQQARGTARREYQALAESIFNGNSPRQAVIESTLLPAWCLGGLDQILAGDNKDAFARIWRQQASLPATGEQPSQIGKSRSARLFLMLFKLNFVLFVFSFIMLYIVPEFRDMFEEFQVQLTDSAIWMIRLAEPILTVASLLALLLLLGTLIGSFLMPWLVGGWLNRWTPFRWSIEPLPRPAQVWQTLGWWSWARLFTGNQQAAGDSPPQPDYLDRLPKQAQEAIVAASRQPPGEGHDIFAAEACGRSKAAALAELDNDQTRSWVMLYKASQIKRQAQNRMSNFVFAIDVVIQVGIGLVVALCCVAIFSLLVKLMGEV